MKHFILFLNIFLHRSVVFPTNFHQHRTLQQSDSSIRSSQQLKQTEYLLRYNERTDSDDERESERKVCGTKEASPLQKERMQNVVEEWRKHKNIFKEKEMRQIDVFFHILHDEDEGYLNENLVMSQIEHLNCAFEGSEIATCSSEDYEDDYEPSSCSRDHSADAFFKTGLQSLKDFTSYFSIEDMTHRRQTEYGSSTPGSGVNTGISFVLKGITRTNNTDYFKNIDLLETEYKPELRQGDCRTLNIYTGDSGSLGWSHYPDICISDMVLDGVILDYKSIAGGMNEYSNEGDALVHVVGQ